ncbi:Deoxyribonuclease II family protein [Trichomonas vaginalis G3]|uniref:Deoxyribonuclease II family protein n=1 Tax=Trichomonas vaginalis (strain ATCC PRA-98 / G3) TaxID=412133 RepID=A2FBC5_TRIV3|nr:deoxyribonuclease II protein [Trichomonas vaginalis G3]EAX97805.1 Deoxyribonuclease II family protein [Trichomonas vaginalis G3]KAI5552719.1 deoxyribonuclease II protein [Trichomonas vaginalis G3]|eukprot:XP_001310735.1 Deoxyribonuclease II family protein [Trichomonas vaginalis G3]
MLKMPRKANTTPLREVGEAFFYMDPTTKLIDSESGVNQTTRNPLYNTLKYVFPKNPEIGYMMMSDQPPNKAKVSDTYAHKKGVLIFDSDNGIYLEHSTPKFPEDPDDSSTYSFASTGLVYGQSFFCLTLTHKDLDGWAEGALIEKPYVYASNIPSYTQEKLPNVIRLSNSEWNDNQMTRIQEINIGEHYIRLYSKHRYWGKDIYHDLLAPDLQTTVLTETWSRGINTMNSNCTGSYHSLNILNLMFQGQVWGRMNDHSKWCIADDYYCIGGINRQEKQLERGGGAWCLKNYEFTKTIRDAITYMEECDLE